MSCRFSDADEIRAWAVEQLLASNRAGSLVLQSGFLELPSIQKVVAAADALAQYVLRGVVNPTKPTP